MSLFGGRVLDYHLVPRDFAVALVLMHESGLVDDPADPGGLTNWGISLRYHQDLGRAGIRSLTREGAVAIYERDYWAVIRGDELPSVVAIVAMDTAVNPGPGRARQWLRQAAGFEANGEVELGPQVMSALRGADLEAALLITRLRLDYYDAKIVAHPPKIRFKRGWRRRSMETLAHAVIYGERNA